MAVSIEIVSESDNRTVPCGPVTTVGREYTNDISLSDQRVSRSNAAFRMLGDGKYYIMDMGSSNGTLVNENRAVAPFALRDGDEVKVGNHTLIFHSDEEDETQTHVEQTSDETMVTFNQKVSNITVPFGSVLCYKY